MLTMLLLLVAAVGGIQFTSRNTWLKNDGAARLGRWIFGEEKRVEGCAAGVVFVTSYPFSADKGSDRVSENCSAVMFLDGEHTDENYALAAMRRLPARVGLVYVGNWREHGEMPPLEPQRVESAERQVVRVYWPMALAGFVGRLFEEGGRMDPRRLARRRETTPETWRRKYGHFAYMSQNCRPDRDALFRRVCAAAAGPCEALSKCPRSPAPGTRNVSRTSSRRDENFVAKNVELYADYKFISALENGASKNGYVSEKIVAAYLSGNIPVFRGDAWAARLFRPETFVTADANTPDELLRLATNASDTELEAMLSPPPLTDLGMRFLLYLGSPNAERLREATDMVLRGNRERLPPAPRVRLVTIHSESHAPERGAWMRPVHDLLSRGLNSTVEIVDAVFFGTSARCGKSMPLGASGVAAAHRDAWKRFLNCSASSIGLGDPCDGLRNDSIACFERRDRRCVVPETVARTPVDEPEQWLLVLEDDVLLLKGPDDVLIQEIQRQLRLAHAQQTDLFFLGSCGAGPLESQHIHKTWTCTHAYAVTLYGAATLLKQTTVCTKPPHTILKGGVPAIDWQMRDLCHDHPDTLNCGGVHNIDPRLKPDHKIGKPSTAGIALQARNTVIHSLRKDYDAHAFSGG